MLINPKDALLSAARYLQQNPETLKRVARNARDYKVTIPLDALRYVARRAEGKKNAPREVVVEATPPGLTIGGLLQVMGTSLRFSATIGIDDVNVSKQELRFKVKLGNVKLGVEGNSESPVAAVIKSGVLDLSKPANIARFMPNRPAAIVEAEDNHVVLDLMREEKLTKNPKFARVVGLVTPVLGVRAIRAEDDALLIELIPRREGVGELMAKAREAVREAMS